ncbi:MAG: GntR family transcriptional regulator YhfZ [Vibrio sp.]|uniref:GntR family transcriptional regulator YhfZ n=1 Tax=Vibrio sp. TaxID=678 RepID=UPI003F37E592
MVSLNIQNPELFNMIEKYLNKEGMALVSLARHLLTIEDGAKLETVESLAENLDISVGYVSRALKTLEQENLLLLNKGGRNGTFLVKKDYKRLFNACGISKLICSMPLPYTKKYEGLASAIKDQLPNIYFAYMNGASFRGECLLNDTCDIAVMSSLASQSLLESGNYKLALNLGSGTYTVGHHLIHRKNEKETIRIVGIDPDSPDQIILTNKIFAKKNVKYVNISYTSGLNAISEGLIDAMVWEISDLGVLGILGLENELIEHDHKEELSSAVLLVNKEKLFLVSYLSNLLNLDKIFAHQKAVCDKLILPSY